MRLVRGMESMPVTKFLKSLLISALLGQLLGCGDLASDSSYLLASEDSALEVMLAESDLKYIERSSLEAYLICDDLDERFKAFIRTNHITAMRSLSFKTKQKLQAGTNCQVEVYGEPKADELASGAITVEWLSSNQIPSLLFISKPAPVMVRDGDPVGLGKGYLTSIFYKTFSILASTKADARNSKSDIIPGRHNKSSAY